MRWVSFVVACGFVGCAAASKAPPRPQPAPDVRPAASASPPSTKAPFKSPSAWTDPEVVDALAKDCTWTPPEPARDPNDMHPQPLPTSCSRGSEQACVYDPCEEVTGRCEGQCEDMCTGCGKACVKHCDACKSACKDDSCRRKCATHCGECRQKCVTGVDLCASATCVRAHAACTKGLVSQWKASGCGRICKQAADCHARCMQNFKEGCEEACRARFLKTCPEKLLGYCLFDPPVLGGPSAEGEPLDAPIQKD